MAGAVRWSEWNEVFQERAAMREYLGGYDRAEAERLARLDAGPEPAKEVPAAAPTYAPVSATGASGAAKSRRRS